MTNNQIRQICRYHEPLVELSQSLLCEYAAWAEAQTSEVVLDAWQRAEKRAVRALKTNTSPSDRGSQILVAMIEAEIYRSIILLRNDQDKCKITSNTQNPDWL